VVSTDAAAALVDLGTSVVSDALRDLGHRERTAAPGLAPVNRRHAAAGPARTARLERAEPDDPRGFAPLAAFIDSCSPGEVLVLGGAEEASPGSVWGEICSAAAGQRGCAAVVIDGYMRDELALEQSELPVFSRGAFAQDCLGRSMVEETGTDTLCGGIRVANGDWVVADADGVVFIPATLLDDVVATAEQKRRVERELLAAVSAGGSLADAVRRAGTL
jgi:4-hydroxy-4-methyl-2-oxoglutarate aldolase